MNFYSEDVFCEAFCAAYFPGQTVKPSLFKHGDSLWRIPALDGVTPISDLPFQSSYIDFYEPYRPEEVTHKNSTDVRPIKYIPRVSHGLVRASEWHDQGLENTYEPAPTILWENFSTWDDFVKHVRNQRSNMFSDSRRRCRKLGKEVGPIEFIYDDRRANVLETCIKWKSVQYRKSGFIDTFAFDEHVQFFKELAKRELIVVSSLSCGEQLIAAQIDLLGNDDRQGLWVPAYDVEYAGYAPGRLLLLFVMEESYKHNHKEFDFLIGNESYKWYYATHARLIGEIGTRPLSMRAKQALRTSLKSALMLAVSPFPNLQPKLKASFEAFNAKMYELSSK